VTSRLGSSPEDSPYDVPEDVPYDVPDDAPIVIAARRTPIGTAGHGSTAGHGLATLEAADLAGPVLAALAADLPAGRHPDDVILGNCRGPGGDIARVAALAAGLGVATPAVTVDRQCGAGLEAVRLAAALVGSSAAEVVLAGGAESASHAVGGRAAFAPAGFDDPDMGPAAEALARERGVERCRQDSYAARSHRLALAAARAGKFGAELVPVAGTAADDRPRQRLTEAVLARLRPAFAADGTVTAGNSCGISDGAAAVTVVSERIRAEHRLPGLRILGTAVAGVEPALPGLGPVPAIQALMRRTGVDLAEVAVLELTEAFAAQVLACTDALGLDPLGADHDRICPQGGAIALGHPWGASGALLVVRLFSALVRSRPTRPGPRYGLAACAIGGGQGLAMLVRAVPGGTGRRGALS
jgi:acetyl-CoA C-acetyltransferase